LFYATVAAILYSVILEEGDYIADVITSLTLLLSKKETFKELRNNNNVLFCPSFLTSNSAQGTLATLLAQISRHGNNYVLHYLILE